MKSNHEHVWKLTSPHPFGMVRRYKCTSCAATRQEGRETDEQKMRRMEEALDFHRADWQRPGGWS